MTRKAVDDRIDTVTLSDCRKDHDVVRIGGPNIDGTIRGWCNNCNKWRYDFPVGLTYHYADGSSVRRAGL